MNRSFFSNENAAQTTSQLSLTAYSALYSGKVTQLLDKAFGLDRQKKSSYELRKTCQKIDGLSYVITQNADENTSVVLASIEYWALDIAGHKALLLGPLAVDPDFQGQGLGLHLVDETIKLATQQAKKHSWKYIILIGDLDYYAKMGFKRVPLGAIEYPQPTDLERILYFEFNQGDLLNLISEQHSPLKLNHNVKANNG